MRAIMPRIMFSFRSGFMFGIMSLIIVAMPSGPIFFIIIPISTSDSGDYRAMWAESEIMQTALNAMMADRKLAAVDGHTTGPAVKGWTGLPTGTGVAALDLYRKRTATVVLLLRGARGEVYPRSDDRDVAKKPGQCPQEP